MCQTIQPRYLSRKLVETGEARKCHFSCLLQYIASCQHYGSCFVQVMIIIWILSEIITSNIENDIKAIQLSPINDKLFYYFKLVIQGICSGNNDNTVYRIYIQTLILSFQVSSLNQYSITTIQVTREPCYFKGKIKYDLVFACTMVLPQCRREQIYICHLMLLEEISNIYIDFLKLKKCI